MAPAVAAVYDDRNINIGMDLAQDNRDQQRGEGANLLPLAIPIPHLVVALRGLTLAASLPSATPRRARHILDAVTETGGAIRAAVSLADPTGAALLAISVVLVCAAAQPLLVLGPHTAVIGALIANHPANKAARAARRQKSLPTADSSKTWTVISWVGAAGDARAIAAAASTVRAATHKARALVTWTDADASARVLLLAVISLPAWAVLHLYAPLPVALAAAAALPYSTSLALKVASSAVSLTRIPPATIDDHGIPQPPPPLPGAWARTWAVFGVAVRIVRVQRRVPWQGYAPVPLDEERALAAASLRSRHSHHAPPLGGVWSERRAVTLPAGLADVAAQGDAAARAWVAAVLARVGVERVADLAPDNVVWSWDTPFFETLVHNDGDEEDDEQWTPVSDWVEEEPPSGLLSAPLWRASRAIGEAFGPGRVRWREYMRQAVCRVLVPASS
ncbi:hypothetical protein BC828DRAFT_379194 [Blastocladiella britannica]|nr:hypothetical protein BC828DRAFT_379194 [Blastocladiella britannica]